jgi:hypothetical protein
MLRCLVIAVAALLLLAVPAHAREETIELRATAAGAGTYLYLPFEVPRGVNRVSVSLDEGEGPEADMGVGLFDQRGPGYGSDGFRGVYGAEANEFFVSAADASRSFLPGRIVPGRWTVIVPQFRVPTPREITVTVTLRFGPQEASARPGPAQGVVRRGAGWYRGDLHNHTTESSDSFSSGSALTPAGYATAARDAGLDFVSLTDHNVVSQNLNLREAAGRSGVLLMGGEEVTNWFHGHATVSGLRPGAFVDWRQRPRPLPLFEHERRIDSFIRQVDDLGVYTSVAHPFGAQLSWQFFGEAATDARLLPDGLEVWNGAFQPDDEATLRYWDEQLRQGRRLAANGGSDVHGFEAEPGITLGFAQPTTVTYARELSTPAIVSALKAGRSFVTESPSGPELYLSGTGPGGQREIVGGTLRGRPADSARLNVVVSGGAGSILVLLRDGAPVETVPVTSDRQEVSTTQRFGRGGYVRAELRSGPHVDPDGPLAGGTGMRALTNPIFLAPRR